MDNESSSPSAVGELAVDSPGTGREVELARLQKRVGEQSEVIAVLQSRVARSELDETAARQAHEKALRAAEREKEAAVSTVVAFREGAAEIKRAYDARALALEQANAVLLRTEAEANRREAEARKMAEIRKEETEKTQQAIAQTFRDFHGLQTAHYALQMESQRTAATAKADAAHAVEMRRSLEERVQTLNRENRALVQIQSDTAHHFGRLNESIAAHHLTQIGRFDTAVAYLGSLLKSPFVRWSLLWRMRRAGKTSLREVAAAPSPAASTTRSGRMP